MLREYKKCRVILTDDLDLGFEIKTAEISFSDEIGLDMKPIKKKFNRAKENRQFKRRIIEDLEEEDYIR